jgi:hypothetical protein
MDAGFRVRIALDTDGLARTFARTRVGRGALTANRQAAQVADAAIALDALQTLEVHTQFAAQVTFDDVFAVLDCMNDLGHLLFRQVLGADLRFDLGFFQDLDRVGRSDAIDVAQSDVDSLVAGDFYSDDSCHMFSFKLLNCKKIRSMLLQVATNSYKSQLVAD